MFGRFHTGLFDYVFTGKIREHRQAGRTLEDAIAFAMDYCIANGILAEYLENNGSEVRNMLLTEWNWEDAQQVWLEEGIEKGREEGIDKGKLEVAKEMFAEGDSLEKIARVTKLPLKFLEEKLLVQ